MAEIDLPEGKPRAVVDGGFAMPGKVDDLLPDANELKRRTAISEARKVDEFVRLLTEAELEKRAFVESFDKPHDGSEEDRIRLVSAIIQRAARSGLCEVQVHRFPDSLCTDGGLAISNDAAGGKVRLRQYRGKFTGSGRNTCSRVAIAYDTG